MATESLRMHNVGIVVEALDEAVAFFSELGMVLEGRAMIEGEWAGRVTGLKSQRVEIAMMATPDGHNRLEISQLSFPGCSGRSQDCPSELAWLPACYVHGRRS